MEKIDSEKLSLFVKAWNENFEAGKPPTESLDIDDFFRESAPEHFTWKHYNLAHISFSDRVEGVVVLVNDCTSSMGDKIAEAGARCSNNRIDHDFMVLLVKGHFAGFADSASNADCMKIFKTDPPKTDAPLKEWRTWVGNLGEKDLNRLTSCILAFRRELGFEGNE